MAIQKQWDKLEAAILLDNYLKYINNEITRKEAIELTSVELRNMAKSQHTEIDDIFRNVNGITFQMHSMESAYRGYTLMKPASKLFIEIVRIYKNDFNEYEEILKEARRMIPNTQSNKDTFFSWVSKEVSPEQLSELYMDYQTIDEFCNKHKIFSGSLLDITDLDKVKRIQRYIETNRLFKFQHKRSMLRINVAIRYYVIYATECFKAVERDYEEKTEIINDEKSVCDEKNSVVEVSDTSTTIQENNDTKYKDKYPNVYPVVYESLKNSADIVGFRGASVIAIYENTRRVASCEIIKEILDNVSWAYSKGPKYFFASESDAEEPTKSEYITSKTNIEAQKIETVSVAEKEKSAVQETSTFKYERKDFSNVPVNEPTISQSRIRSTSAADAFYDWLSGEQGLAVPTCRSYVSAVNCAEAFAKDNNFINQKLYTTDLNEAQETVKELLNNPAFIEMDNKQHHRFKSGLNKLLQYVGGGSIAVAANEVISSGRIKNTSESDAFYDWLLQEQGLAEPTCRSYVSAVNCAEAFARDNNFVNQALYTSNPNEAQATVKELLNNSDFIEMDNKQHHRFKSGLNKLLQYVGGLSTTTNVQSSFDAEPFNGILIERFARGYRMGSPLELRKFKRYWEGIYGTSPEWSDDEISKRIALCGIVHEDKVYMPQKMLDDDTRMKLFSYINKSFQEGKNVIYYEALFKEFSDDFLEHCMYNAEMLKAYLT